MHRSPRFWGRIDRPCRSLPDAVAWADHGSDRDTGGRDLACQPVLLDLARGNADGDGRRAVGLLRLCRRTAGHRSAFCRASADHGADRRDNRDGCDTKLGHAARATGKVAEFFALFIGLAMMIGSLGISIALFSVASHLLRWLDETDALGYA